MELRDWITAIAILLAPIFAVQIQKRIEQFRWKKNRKLGIFETLMSTRRAKLSARHVEALNMIDVAFSSQQKNEKEVINAWKAYLDNLTALEENPSDAQLQIWIARSDDLFTELLFKMSKVVGYEFDKTHLKRSIYSPRGHSEDELDMRTIRKGLVGVFTGTQSIPIEQTVSGDAFKKQSDFQESLRAYMDGDHIFNVRLVRNVEDKNKPKD